MNVLSMQRELVAKLSVTSDANIAPNGQIKTKDTQQ